MGYLNLSLFSKTSRLNQILTAVDDGSAPVLSIYAGGPPPSPDDPPGGALLAALPCSSPFGAVSNAFDIPVITAAGSGYTSIPTFAPVGQTGGSGAQFQPVMQVATCHVAVAGTQFQADDLLVLPALSPTCLQPAVLKVTSIDSNGGILAASIQQAGQFITTLPSGPVSEFETSGVGRGATITFDTYSVAGVNALVPGQNYTSAGASGPALFTGGGGTGAAAAVRLTPILNAGAISTTNAVSGGTAGMARVSCGGGLALTISAPGSGGANGTFALAVSGGTGSGFSGSFTVAGGEAVALQIENPGVYTVAPGVVLTASAGLSGASVIAALGAGVVDLDVGVAGSGASVIINSTNIITGGPVVVTSAYIVEA